MATDDQAAHPRDAEIALAQVRPLPNPPLARPLPTRQTARKGRLNFLYLTNTLLFRAIAHNNAEAVRELLALGADTSGRRDDGASLLDAARLGTQPARKEIRRMLLAKMGRPEGWTDVPVDLPKEGRWYTADRTIGVPGMARTKLFEAGMTLLASGHCSLTAVPFTCFTFYSAPGKYYGTVVVPISRPEDFNALREVEAPTSTP